MDHGLPSSTLLPLVLNALPGAIFWKDRQSVYLGCNQSFARDAGLPNPAAIVGKTDDDMPWAGEQAAFFRMVDARVMENDAAEYGIHEPITKADGTLDWIETNKAPIHDAEGRVIGIVGTYIDITERKRIALEQQRLTAVVENSSDIIGIASMTGEQIYLNPAGLRILGIADMAEALRSSSLDYFLPEDRPFVENTIIPAVMSAGRWEGEFRMRNFATNAIIPIYYTLFTIHDQDTGEAIAIASVSRDLTAQRAVEAERQRVRVQEEMIKAQSAILAELSTPLIPITEGIVVMPLIGTIDSSRAQQVMDTLLDGVVSTGVHTAIIDITGVPVVDTQIANALLRTTQAVTLVGAKVMLTGIRPEVAQTLVGLGVDLREIRTYSNLQQGVAVALQQREGGKG